MMGIADMIIVGVVGFSAIFGLVKGFLREFISLAALIAGLVVAFYFAEVPVQWIPDEAVEIMGESLLLRDLGLIASFIVTVLIVLIIGRLLSLGAAGLVSQGGVRRLDQFIGFLFGIVRGGLIVVLLVIAAGLTRLPSSEAWNASVLLPPFTDIAAAVAERLPSAYGRHFMFDAVADDGLEEETL